MAKNKTTYEIELRADLDNLLEELDTAQKKLSTLLSSNSAPKGLEKAFEKVKNLLGQISDKSSHPMDGAGFKRARADVDKVAEGLSSINRLVGEFADLADDVKISFLPDGEKQKIEEATKAMEKYLGLVAAANAKEKDLKGAEKTKGRAEGRLKSAEDKITGLSGKKAKKAADLEGKKGVLAAADVEGANPEKIAKYRAEIIGLEADLKDLDTQLGAANRELNDAQTEYDEATRVVKALSGEIKNLESSKLKELKDQAIKMGISLEGIKGKKTSKQIELLTYAIEENKKTIMSGARPAYEEWKNSMNKTGEEVDKLGEKLEAGAEKQRKLEEATAQQGAFEAKIKQFLGLQGAAQLMRSALRDAMATIKELDAAMTEMAVVTDLSVGDYWDQLPQYTARANELGVSISSVYKASTLYYQQGLKANEVTELSNETLKMAKIAGLDAAEATDRMTAALRGFNMELNQTNAQKVADVYSELAAITASDVDEISTAMTKTASIAASAGMGFETTAAFLSQIIETTRESAETAGTAMKTVIARFQELKKAPDEIGEIDGEIIDANAIEAALRSVGVSLRDSSGQFRELDEVFLELSGKWDSLDKNTQRYIATIAAGSRQQSRFIAMMSDYNRTQELVTAANNSAGASNEQFAKTLDSLESKMEKLKNAWHEFTMGIMDSELVKIGVDILTKFLEVVNKATSGIDGLGGSIVKIFSILTVFKLGSTVFEKLKQPLIGFFAEIVKEAGLAGENAAKAAKAGVEKVQNEEGSSGENKKSSDDSNNQQNSNGPGFKAMMTGFEKRKEEKKKLNEMKEKGGSRKQRENKLNQKKNEKASAMLSGSGAASGMAAQYDAEIAEAEKSLKEFDDQQQKVANSSAEIWTNMGAGVANVGSTIASVGAGFSMFGGILSALGLEEMGEIFTKFGNVITIVGVAVMGVGKALALIPPILTFISAHPIIAILVGIVAAIMLVVAAVDAFTETAEEKLERVTEEANRAAEAADRMAESYENLKSSLDGLEDKYKALEGLTEGTQEWNDAVQEINDSVLNLIDEYPELASMVQADANGVLRLDTESAEVQAVLNEKKMSALAAKNNANMAKVEVKQAEANLAYERLDRDAKLGSKSDTNNLARALASGAIAKGENGFKVLDQNKLDEMGIDFSQSELDSFYAVVGDNVDQLKEYGEQLEATTAQEKAMFQAMATQVTTMTDTTGWTDMQKEQLSNMLDSDTMSTIYKDEMSDLEGKNFTDKDEDDEERKLKEDAVKATYGENARYENGKVFYTDENGEEVEADLSNDEWKRMIASNETTKRATAAAKALPDAINKSIDMTTRGMSEEDREKTAEVMNKAMADKSGKNLTKAEMTQLQNTEQMNALQFMSLSRAEKDALGGSYANYIKNITEAQEAAEKGWADLSNEMTAYGVDFQGITLGAAEGLMDNFEKVASISGKASADAVAQMTQSILSAAGDRQEEVAARINATEWTSVESLNDLQYDLINSYGLSETTAKNYIDSLKEASFATSKFAYTIDALGEFYVASQKLEQALKKASDAEWEYQKALDGHGEVTDNMIKEMAEAQLEAFAASKEMRDAAELDVLRAYGEGSTFSDKHGNSFASQWSLDENNQLVNKDGMSMLEYKQQHLTEEQSEQFDSWVENISEQVDKIQESEDAQKEAIDALYDLQAQSEESYYELRDMIKEALDADIQEFIDLQQEEIEATKETADAIANKIQQQIDEERQARQNQDQLKAITDAQAKLAYLKMDTSGMNDLDILSLQNEIDTMEQEYTDTLIDQKLEEFIDANQLAYDQREEQIRLLQAQASSFTQSEVYQQQIKNKLDEALNGNQGVLSWLADYHTQGMSQQEKEDWEQELDNTTTLANYFMNGAYKDENGNVFSGGTQDIYYKNENGKLSYITSQDYNKLDQEAKNTYSRGTATVTAGSNGNHSMTITGADGTEVASDIDLSGGSFESIANSMVTQIGAQRANDGRRDSLIQKGYDAGLVQSANEAQLTNMENAYANLVGYQNPNADISLSATKVAGFLGANTRDIMNGDKKLDNRYDAEKLNIWDYGEMAEILQTNSGYVPASITYEWTEPTGNMIVEATVAGASDSFVHLSNDVVTRHTDLLNQLYIRTGGGQVANGATLILQDELIDVFGTNGLLTYWNGGWRSIVDEFENNANSGNRVQYAGLRGGKSGKISWNETWVPGTLHNAARNYRKIAGDYASGSSRFAFKTGGLADFTGPAWLDGTPSKPEYVLNAVQTERFFSLIDVLESFSKNSNGGSTSGDTTIDIDINVEKISDDYDVEKLANKIRSMLYQDATYRNVNNISHTR